MRYILIMVILLSLAIPVFAQGDGDQHYTIDSEGWFITVNDDGDVFYSNNENFEPDESWNVISFLEPDDIVVDIRVDSIDDARWDTLPSDPPLFLGMRYGIWLSVNVFASNIPSDAIYSFSEVDVVMFDEIEFQGATFTVEEFGVYTQYIHMTDEHEIILNIFHRENTDVTPAIELLETVEFLISD